jgi:type 1 glutamine amidotransferase
MNTANRYSPEDGLSRREALASGALLLGSLALPAIAEAAEPTRVMILVGPSQHPPGTHEVEAGGRLMKHALESADKLGVAAEVLTEWPKEEKSLEKFASVVLIGDLFPPELMPNRERIMADLARMMDRGCGMVCVHYATGLGAKQVPEDGDHPLLRWLGGYFATRCPHHQSVARLFPEATIDPAKVDHPVVRGWKRFTLNDEPYINNYFGKEGPAKNVTILATSMLPPEAPKSEAVAWAVSRKDGGRGVGVVMPHFFKNWQLDDLRMLILNAIVWTAKLEVPPQGVDTKLPELTTFKPASVEPVPRKKK